MGSSSGQSETNLPRNRLPIEEAPNGQPVYLSKNQGRLLGYVSSTMPASHRPRARPARSRTTDLVQPETAGPCFQLPHICQGSRGGRTAERGRQSHPSSRAPLSRGIGAGAMHRSDGSPTAGAPRQHRSPFRCHEIRHGIASLVIQRTQITQAVRVETARGRMRRPSGQILGHGRRVANTPTPSSPTCLLPGANSNLDSRGGTDGAFEHDRHGS